MPRLLIRTKLGPVIEQTSGTAEYNGRFRAYSGVGATSGVVNTDTDFTLTVTFGGTTRAFNGAQRAGVQLEAFVKQTEIADREADDNYFHLIGTYDANGVITGQVDFGAFTGGLVGGRVLNGRRKGLLSGLISQDNAVGVFIGGTSVDGAGRIFGGRGDDGFVGGFVARAFVPDNAANTVDYNDWVHIANPDAVAGDRSAFVQTKAGDDKRVLEFGVIVLRPQPHHRDPSRCQL